MKENLDVRSSLPVLSTMRADPGLAPSLEHEVLLALDRQLCKSADLGRTCHERGLRRRW